MIWIVTFIILIVFLLLSIPVASTMGVLGFILGKAFSPFPLHRAIGEVSWAASANFSLFAIPLFVLLGQILVKSGIAERTYQAVDRWLSWLPGGLMHANIATCALFAATSGSSVATGATMGTVALPQGVKYGYNEGLFAGTIAAGGTLGILIPPSINLIVYGFLTNTSIPKLFIAGIVPGVLLAIIFMVFILIACIVRPSLGSHRRSVSWAERFGSLKDLIPMVGIFVIVIGSIYAGFATPTESAALGVLGSLGIAAAHRKLTLKALVESFEGTLRTTGMIMFIIVAANFLNFILISLGLTDQITSFISTLGFTPFQTLLVIVGMYIILGFFIETLSLMVLTIPVVAPIITDLGYDPIWFGILLILLIEMALITPPVGLNLYVVQGVRERGSIGEIAVGIIPFVFLIMLMIGIIIRFPGLVSLLL
ncbi:MAG: TRAP transporter large permease [Synergistales bacterium]|nr:TRAP transporter large permease [Synergistales bacterium]